jgi:hypothetical protein
MPVVRTQSRGDQGPTGGPVCYYSTLFDFSNGFALIPWKGCLPAHQIFQIKYGHVDDLIRNKFLHWSFSNFGMEFELKIWEPIWAKFDWIWVLGTWKLQIFVGIWYAGPWSPLVAIGTWIQAIWGLSRKIL